MLRNLSYKHLGILLKKSIFKRIPKKSILNCALLKILFNLITVFVIFHLIQHTYKTNKFCEYQIFVTTINTKS